VIVVEHGQIKGDCTPGRPPPAAARPSVHVVSWNWQRRGVAGGISHAKHPQMPPTFLELLSRRTGAGPQLPLPISWASRSSAASPAGSAPPESVQRNAAPGGRAKRLAQTQLVTGAAERHSTSGSAMKGAVALSSHQAALAARLDRQEQGARWRARRLVLCRYGSGQQSP